MQVKYIEEAKNKLEKQAKPLTQKVDKTNQLISELKNKIEKMENHSQNDDIDESLKALSELNNAKQLLETLEKRLTEEQKELDVFWSSQEVDDTIGEALSRADNLSNIQQDLLKSTQYILLACYFSIFVIYYLSAFHRTPNLSPNVAIA